MWSSLAFTIGRSLPHYHEYRKSRRSGQIRRALLLTNRSRAITATIQPRIKSDQSWCRLSMRSECGGSLANFQPAISDNGLARERHSQFVCSFPASKIRLFSLWHHCDSVSDDRYILNGNEMRRSRSVHVLRLPRTDSAKSLILHLNIPSECVNVFNDAWRGRQKRAEDGILLLLCAEGDELTADVSLVKLYPHLHFFP
jgi:hypothetical protein